MTFFARLTPLFRRVLVYGCALFMVDAVFPGAVFRYLSPFFVTALMLIALFCLLTVAILRFAHD